MSALDHHTASADAPAFMDGTRVAMRRVRLRDLDALRAIAARAGILCEEFELARLVRSDPGDRLVLCATAVRGGVEVVLGVGVIERSGSTTMPSLILVEPAYGRPLADLLADALIARARAVA
ncbi:MAG TPA: hypothetical protein VFN65_05915 [Solirubrobacteraceae bacterium]|nr:hypothetical protein [Solirubrobacteraceae bacterium]